LLDVLLYAVCFNKLDLIGFAWIGCRIDTIILEEDTELTEMGEAVLRRRTESEICGNAAVDYIFNVFRPVYKV